MPLGLTAPYQDVVIPCHTGIPLTCVLFLDHVTAAPNGQRDGGVARLFLGTVFSG